MSHRINYFYIVCHAPHFKDLEKKWYFIANNKNTSNSVKNSRILSSLLLSLHIFVCLQRSPNRKL